MSSIYDNIPGEHFYQVSYASDAIMSDKSLTLGQRAGAVFLHKFLYGLFQSKTKVSIRLTAKEIYEGTLIDKKKLKNYRDILIKRKLIAAKKGNGFHTYTAVHSKTGEPLPKPDNAAGRYDFDKSTNEQMYRFYSSRLGDAFKLRGTQIQARCPNPGHTDFHYSFSLSIKDGSGGPWKCNGCGHSGKMVEFEKFVSGGLLSTKDAHRRARRRLSSLGLKRIKEGSKVRSDDRVYHYEADYGEVVCEKVKPVGKTRKPWFRRQDPNDPEKFINNLEGVGRILYRLPEVRDADTVIVTEGESDVEAIRSLQLLDCTDATVAVTCNMHGAHNWTPEDAAFLKGKFVIVIGDNDTAGKVYVQSVRESLIGIAKEVQVTVIPQIPDLPIFIKDARDFIEAKEEGAKSSFLQLLPQDWMSDSYLHTVQS